MKQKQYIITGSIIAAILIVGSIFILTNQNKSSSDTSISSTKKTEIMVNLSSSKSSDVAISTNSTISANQNISTQTSKVIVESGYINYDQAKLSNAKYGKVVLFFHASWCPSCKGLDEDIKKNLDKIPSDLLILKVDYDSSTELKSKYKVTSQHTLIQVDESGNLIKPNPGLYQLETLDSVIKSF